MNNLISAVHVEGLFGKYNYVLPADGTSLSNSAIFYGDNGVGKSTLLRLVFHLLSPGNSQNHRTSLYYASFDYLLVKLSSGITVSAKKNKRPDFGDAIILELKIENGKKTLAKWSHIPKDLRVEAAEYSYTSHIRILKNMEKYKDSSYKQLSLLEDEYSPRANEQFLSVLKDVAPTVFILNAERKLDSDVISDPEDQLEIRRDLKYEKSDSIYEIIARSREIALSQALSRAANWIRKKAVIGSNRGSTNVHSVYENVVNQILQDPTHAKDITKEKLIESLSLIEKYTTDLAKYEMSAVLKTSSFIKALNKGTKHKKDLTKNLLIPYVESLEKKLEAVDPIYKVTDNFVKEINKFLFDKNIFYTLSRGFGIGSSPTKLLDPAKLSSGEQQLLLLFCYVLISRDHSSVFIIDEPEISLNIKWQRQLIQSLLNIVGDSTTQFIFASHSVELLSQHRNSVVVLK